MVFKSKKKTFFFSFILVTLPNLVIIHRSIRKTKNVFGSVFIQSIFSESVLFESIFRRITYQEKPVGIQKLKHWTTPIIMPCQ